MPRVATPRPGLRAIVYIRVSQDRTDESTSPELQKHQADLLAARESYKIIRVIKDINKSGRSFNKRKVDQVILMFENSEADVLILWTWSRFGRNTLESLTNLKQIEEAGGIVRAVKEDFDNTTPAGRFAITNMLAIAQLQSDQLGETWRETHQRRQRNGLHHAGSITAGKRFGYLTCYTCPGQEKGRKRQTCPDCKDGILKPDPTTGPILAEMYRRLANGEPVRTLCLELKERGIRSTTGAIITPPTLMGICDTRFGLGYNRARSEEMLKRVNSKGKNRIRGNGIDTYDIYEKGKHRPVIEDERECETIWEAYVQRRKDSADKPPRLNNPKYSVSGLLRCSGCGSNLGGTLIDKAVRHPLIRGAIDPRDVYFRCVQGIKMKTCPQPSSITLARIERIVLRWLQQQAQGEDTVEVLARRKLSVRRAENRVNTLEADAIEKEEHLDRLVAGYVTGKIPLEQYEKLKDVLESELHELREVLANHRRSIKNATRPAAELFLGLTKEWEQASQADRRHLLTQVIHKITVNRGSGVASRDEDKVNITGVWDAICETSDSEMKNQGT